MIQDVWKKFDEAALTHSSVHHLLAIRTLTNEQGYVRGIDIAKYLQLTRGSISITIKKLKTKGYITEDQNKFLGLSDKGIVLVNAVLSKRRLFEKLFSTILKVDPTIAEEDACKIEHLLTHETSAKLLSFIGFYLSAHPQAHQFRKEYETFSYQCNNFKEACSICEIDCFYTQSQESVTN